MRAALRLLMPLAGVLLLMVLVLAGAAGAVRWAIGSEAGSRWLIGHLPGVEASGLKGALIGPDWQLDRLSVQWGGGRNRLVMTGLDARGLRWQAWPGSRAWVGLDIASLAARSAELVMAADPTAKPAPLKLPQDLAPPLRLHVGRARLDTLVINAGQPLTAISLQGVDLDPGDAANHRVEAFAMQGFGVGVQGSAAIANRAPLALVAQLSLQPSAAGGSPRWGASLHAEGPLARLVLSGTLRGVPVDGRAAPSVDLQAQLQPEQPWPLAALKAQTTALDLAALSPLLPQTQLAGTATVSGGAPGQPLLAEASLRNGRPGRWDERRLPVARLELGAERAASQPDRLRLTHFEIDFADATRAAGRVRGSALWQAGTLGLKTVLEGVKPQQLDGRAPAITVSGPVELDLRGLPAPDGSVAPAAPGAAWKLDLSGRLERNPQPLRLQLAGSADDEHLVLRLARVQAGAASADLQVQLSRVGQRDWQLASTGSLKDFDPRPWWNGAAAAPWRQGRSQVSADWKFEFRVPANAERLPTLALAQRLVGNGRLRVHDSELAGVPLAGEITLGYTQAAAPVPGSLNADFEIGGNRFAIEGRGDPAGPGSADRWRAEIKAESLATLAPLVRLVPALATWAPRQGSLSGVIAADGRWPALHTEGNLRASQLVAGELQLARGAAGWAMNLRGDRPLAFQLDLAGLEFGNRRADNLRAELHGTAADHHIEISGALPLLPPQIAVQMLGIEAQSGTQAQLQAQGSWQPDPAGGGSYRARVAQLVVGSWDGNSATAPSASGWLQAKDLNATLDFDADGALVALKADPGRLQLSDTASLRWDAVSLDLRGGQLRGELHASIEPFLLAPLLARVQPELGWQGDLRLGGRVDIRAGDKLDADLVFERGSGDLHVVSGGNLQLLGLTDLHLALAAHDGLWKFSPLFRGRSLGEISGEVQVRTAPERRWPDAEAPLAGTLRLQVADIGIWSTWVPPGWRLTGELATTATISGRFGQPEYSGQLVGSGLGVRNLLQGVNVHDGQLAVRLAGDTAQIERFSLQGGDGKAEVTGSASLGAAPKARLQLHADHFRLLGRVDRQIVASGDAELELDADQTRMSGKFKLDEGVYDTSHADAPSLDDDVAVRRAGSADETHAAAAAPKPRRGLALDLSVDLGEKMHVLGRGLDTELRGEVRITTPGGRLAVNGTIRTEGGTYAAYGQNLDIDRGIVAFSGVPDNPRLDILALRPNLDVQVGVQIGGNLQSPRVRLYSDPDMADSDKLSWLLLGRAPDNLGRNDTALLQQAAMALISGEGKAPTDVLLHNLGIDQLSVHQSDTDVHETVVSLGKQLSRNWYLGYERGVNATGGTWQLIYRIAQRFTLRLQSGLDNSADVIWSWRFQEPPKEAAMRKSTVVPP